MSTLYTPIPQRRVKNETFIKTPRVRKSLFHNESVESSNKLKEIGLQGIMWETYRVNALYSFSYQNEKIKQYQILLASQVQKAVLENPFELPDESFQFIVKVEPLPFTAFTERDSPAVKISIMKKDGEYRVSCFTGFLLSVGRKEGFLEKERIRADAVILPLLLVSYTDTIYLESVLSFLEDNFHCFVGPLKFSPYDLMWMLALWSCPQNRNPTSATILEYELPFEELNSMEYMIDPKSMSETSERILKPNAAGEISENQVDAFLSELEKHFYKMYSIEPSNFHLSVIKIPIARVQGDHSILVRESHGLFSIMRHLTHLSQEMGR